MNKKIIAASIAVAATAGIVTYIYLKKKRELQKKNLPVSFI